ncbi:UDP-N-acetylmuramoyl-L-alanyl-D-glutamate--2,6-diaminopimelate ligase [Geobacter sp. DSM 9736]|uniref:UDP-N-acetylmuramoyl-L-alanyl-D-glutamate--2, 6-diaminopimelate ligase n=1 Tax=Geobacter sp. DSM 9736 TaxID=1277350 RepID=UPI000B50DE57|nr:UDP-N-acetylmuramoyl-L-alanyl-D-glutamate--2,6-diaminopimelate ligase [Geobacter sp. DSM 9736]SNB47812.1 UDP-N-acetylmuramoylalanyl-D-glutamate--2,6-diaminopimelate ligase [Geobacter sp. DSM 9736]
MLCTKLIEATEPLATSGVADREISGLSYDSRTVQPGDMFFALRGAAADGHRFLGAAVEAGAAVLVVEDESLVPAGTPYVKVVDSRMAMARAAAEFYGNPSLGLPLIGITGTNGKTTTTYLVEAILAHAGLEAAVLGTISYRFRDLSIPAPHTTPESVDLQKILRDLVNRGAAAVVMEVSSHSLEQRRVDGCRFDVGIFTNLTHDHLDYHHTMEAYLGSKIRLFSELLKEDREKPRRRGVVNVDDPYGPRFARGAACPVITYGLLGEADVIAKDVQFSVNGIAGTLVTPLGKAPFRSRMLGRFNMYNILAAAAAGIALDLPLHAIVAGIEQHRSVPGRLERVENDRGVTVLVDYAHTGDALENVLRTVRDVAQGRLITVFGCGGDRDRTKRPVMGEVAVRFSDLAVVTSDNPRTEQPADIIADIRAGIEPLGVREYRLEELSAGTFGKGFIAVESRRDAIKLAINLAKPGDVVLLAGKGHEDYQIIGTVKHHFDDREEAAAAFRELS